MPAGRVAAATLTPAPLSAPTPAASPISPIPGDDAETQLGSGPPEGGAAPGAGGPLGPGDAFGPRYRILRLLGEGGMGVVYHAWDEELGVAVALKLIRPEVSADPATARELEKRFKRELLLARQVTHRNVVRIHDIGEVEGTKYITMSFIAGRDLASVLKGSGHLSVQEALPLVRQLAAGLQAAHDAGVIHRDLKPANIMVEGDAPIIMDFGIARSAVRPIEGNAAVGTVPLSPSALVTGATVQGTVVGTVAYMSPEQAKGQPADQRSDIYAAGMIMRDMLVGVREVENPSDALNELMARVEHAPTPVKEIDPSIPDDVDRITTRCLQPDPAARFQSVEELLADLNSLDAEGRPLPKVRPLTKRIVGAAALAVLTLLGATWWLAKTRVPPPEPDPVSVLITNFENRTADPVFEGSLEQALTADIEGASFVTAYSRTAAQRLASQLKPGSKLDIEMARVISMREGIKVILAGAIAPTRNGYEISVRALDPALEPDKSEPLAEARASASSKPEVLSAVGSLAARIRGALGDVTSESARLAAAETYTAGSLEAMRAYARGQELALSNKIPEALRAYEEAVSLDPRFGRAYAGMGVIYSNLKQEDKAKSSWQEALKHTDRMTEREKYRTLGMYTLQVARNYEQAAENFQELVERYPADDGGHGNLALAYLYLGRLQDAVTQVRKSLEIYPKNSLQRHNYAMYAMFAGEFDTALAEGARVLKENPSFAYWTLIPIAVSHLALGDAKAARDAYSQLEQLSPEGKSLAALGVGDLEMYYGRHKAALQVLRAGITADEKLGSSGETAQKYVAVAEAYLALGQRGRAGQAAAKAATLSSHESVLFPAARALLEAGQEKQAEKIAATLENMLQRQTTAYGRMITGELAVRRGQLAAGIEAFRDAEKRHDWWFVRFLLGKTYAEAGHYAEAMRELDLCIQRRGETTGVFSYDAPTIRYLPPAYYWLARAQEGIGASAEARKNYEAFLTLRANADTPDPLGTDARRRVAALSP